MSRFRSSNDDLAYGEIPQRWDRDRFERFGRQGPPPPAQYEDTFRFTERERPGRVDIAIAERRESSRPGNRWEERDRYYEQDRARSRPRRRTDKELFGDVDPREIVDMALTPYKRTSVTREDFDIEQRAPRPGLLRRQSSLDTFDRRPARYEREEYRVPPYTPVPLPIRKSRGEWDEFGYRDDDLESYKEVEIQRERSVHRRRPRRSEPSVKEEKVVYHHHHHSDSGSSSSTDIEEEIDTKSKASKSRKSSRAPTVKAPSTKARSTRAPSVHESFHETVIEENIGSGSSSSIPPPPSIHESFHGTTLEEIVREERKFKKGKTRMPKRLVRREAIMDLGYPFDEEEDFFVLRIALEKEQIDEVIKITETYKDGEKRKVYKFEEKIEETVDAPAAGEHEEIQRTEWINPPSVAGSRSRRTSRAPSAPPPPTVPEYYEEHKTIVEERSPSHHHAGTIMLAEREHRSDRDINAEIRALEQERRALRFEREADEKRELALRLRERPDDEYAVVDLRSRSRPREELVLYEREKSPARNVVRIEKDRKERRQAKLLAAAMATLT